MKQRLFMYLFIFSLLILVFQFANSKRILNRYEKDIRELKLQLKHQKNLVESLQTENLSLKDFSLENNDAALSFFENKGYRTEKLLPAILDGLYNTNNYKGLQHPLVPYASTTKNKIIINNVKILNHKWLIANFTDGNFWGEVLVSYFVESEQDISYKLESSLLYINN